MDDLRTDLASYFDAAVTAVDIAQIVDSDSVVGVAIPPEKELRYGGRWRPALASVAAVLFLWGLMILTGGSQRDGDPAGPAITTSPTSTTTRSDSSTGQVMDLLDFEFTTPPGWDSMGGFRLQKSAKGPQGAEGIVYWVSYPSSDNATNCMLRPDFASTDLLGNLALEVAHTPGLTLVSGPDEVVVGGQTARYVNLEITADEGCDPGYFYNWKAEDFGQLWLRYSVGEVVDVWVVGESIRLVIVGLTDPGYPALRDEIQDFVSSIVFSSG